MKLVVILMEGDRVSQTLVGEYDSHLKETRLRAEFYRTHKDQIETPTGLKPDWQVNQLYANFLKSNGFEEAVYATV